MPKDSSKDTYRAGSPPPPGEGEGARGDRGAKDPPSAPKGLPSEGRVLDPHEVRVVSTGDTDSSGGSAVERAQVARSLGLKEDFDAAYRTRRVQQELKRIDFSAGCANPVSVLLKPDINGERCPAFVRCRHCKPCRLARSRRWWVRSMMESHMHEGGRIWLVTLTYRDEVTQGEYRPVQLMLKRLRKRKMKFRYICVLERGTRYGRLHWHMLLFETDASNPIRKRVLQSEWRMGFSHLRLVRSARDISYVAGYTAKDMMRVHSSLRFGKPTGMTNVGADQPQAEVSENPLRKVKTEGDGDRKERET